MSHATYFVQECPTCGRQLQVRVSYLGRLVICRHCHGRFQATDPQDAPAIAPSDSGLGLMRRVEELLSVTDVPKKHPR